jgi:O-antigen biosynthesis protein
MQIRVLLINPTERQREPEWIYAQPWEANKFDVTILESIDYQRDVRLLWDSDVIVTFGDWTRYSVLSYHYEIRRKWVSMDLDAPPSVIGKDILYCYMGLLDARQSPMVSVFTGAYRTPVEKIQRAYKSLLDQTWTNWEWVIFDDSGDDGKTYGTLQKLFGHDGRVRIFQNPIQSGKIGYVKKMAAGLCVGEYLAELDHDDYLTRGCLTEVVKQFKANPGAGMVWTNCTEVDATTGKCHIYPDGWGLGGGSYRREDYDGITYDICQGPELTGASILHIVGVPNHIRVWERKAYHDVGGHSQYLAVCDDYELIIRTWLKYPIVHSPFFGYVQEKGPTTTYVRNKEIQRTTKWISEKYYSTIYNRAIELGQDHLMRK